MGQLCLGAFRMSAESLYVAYEPNLRDIRA